MAFRVSDFLLDKRVLQSLVDGDAFGWVQHQGAIDQVLQRHHLLPLVLGQALASDHVRQQVFGGVDGAHHRHFLLMGEKKTKVRPDLITALFLYDTTSSSKLVEMLNEYNF